MRHTLSVETGQWMRHTLSGKTGQWMRHSLSVETVDRSDARISCLLQEKGDKVMSFVPLFCEFCVRRHELGL